MASRKSDRGGHQIAAPPLRLAADGLPELLLVTSRTTRRWIVPKSWPMKGLKNHKATRIEPRGEAGA